MGRRGNGGEERKAFLIKKNRGWHLERLPGMGLRPGEGGRMGPSAQ